MMKQTEKRWLLAATVLIVLGVVVFVGAMTANHWEFARLSTTDYQTSTHEIDADFQDISLDLGAADLTVVPSEDGTCRVVCYESEIERYTVAAEDGRLTVRAVNTGKWAWHMGITFEMPRITVYLPKEEYGALSIQGSIGSIEIPAGVRFTQAEILSDMGDVEWYASAAEQIEIEVSTGDIHMDNVSAGALALSADTGDIVLERVTVSGAMTIGNDTGDVILDGCDAGELEIEVDTGDVTGTLLSEKVFLTESDTGSVCVPKTVTGGRCEIRTDTGDIQIELTEPKE